MPSSRSQKKPTIVTTKLKMDARPEEAIHFDESSPQDMSQPRRNSLNVASFYRSKSSVDQKVIDDGSSSDESDSNQSIAKRRRSLDLGSVRRDETDEAPLKQEPPSGWWRTPRPTLKVGMSTIRRHVQWQEEMDETTLDFEPQNSQAAKTAVRFTLPEEEAEFDEDFTYFPTTSPRTVTFGAYYDNHNDEMIPELCQIENETVKKSAIDIIRSYFSDAPPPLQILATTIGCLMMHGIQQAHPEMDMQVLTMILVTLCGATFPHLITAVACGVYAGSVSAETLPSTLWVLLLGIVTALVWQVVTTWKLMLGFSGRLGASAFVGMNITALIAFALDSEVNASRYTDTDNDEAFWASLSIEEAVVTWSSCVFIAVSAAFFRKASKVPVNPVLVPSAWALFCMLLVSLVDYRFNPSIFGGFAVGSYVAMAAESRLPTLQHFLVVGSVAGLYILLLLPFFPGFGGKSGFTAMIAFSTCYGLKRVYKKVKLHLKQKQKQKTCKDDQSTNADDADNDEYSV